MTIETRPDIIEMAFISVPQAALRLSPTITFLTALMHMRMISHSDSHRAIPRIFIFRYSNVR